jgi:propanol-preferring alcohol dehydrogenase
VEDELVAPILCGGVTAYKAVKVGGAVPGQWVVVSGAGGGVGALGVQYAKAMGYRVVAVDLGVERKGYCLELGAEAYFDAKDADLVARVQGVTGGDGASAVLVMANSNKAYQAALEMVAPYGTLVCVGFPPPEQMVTFHPQLLVSKNVHIVGSAVGTRKDIWDAIGFVERGVVKPKVERAKLEDLSDIASSFGQVSLVLVNVTTVLIVV